MYLARSFLKPERQLHFVTSPNYCSGKICMQLASRSLVLCLSFLFAMLCSSSFRCVFIVQTQTNIVNVCAELISLRSEHFLVTSSMCTVFMCTNSRHTLKTSLCCAFYWETHVITTPSICCVFICTNPNQTSILGSGGNLQLPRKKEIN